MHTAPLDTVNVPRNRRSAREKTQRFHVEKERIAVFLPGFAAFFLMNISTCFTLPSPFALVLLISYLVKKGSCPEGACLGMTAGLLMRLIWGIDTDAAQAIVFFGLAVFVRRKISVSIGYKVLLGALIMRSLPGMIGRDVPEMMVQLGSILLGMCVMPAMLRSTEILMQKSTDKTQDDMLCLSMPWMMLLCGAAHLQMFGINLGVIGGCISVLMTAWTCGAAAAATVGIGAGFALLAGGMHVMYFMLLPFAGLIGGCFQKKKRIGTAAAFFFSGMMLVYVTLQRMPEAIVVNFLFSMGIFLAIPRKKARSCLQKVIRLQWIKPKENAFLRMRMQQWVQAIHRLSQVLPDAEIPMDSRETEAESLAEKLCRQCDLLPVCWRDEYEKTKTAMEAAVESREMDLNVINRHFDHCQRLKEVPGCLQHIYEKRAQNHQKRHLAAYERHMLETHLLALSQAAQLISLEGLQADEEETEWQTLAEEALEKMHFSGRLSFIKCIDGHLMAAVQSDVMPIQPALAEKVAQQLGLYLGRPLEVTEQNASRVIMEESPVFQVVMGRATAAAAVAERTGYPTLTEENGDAVMVRSLSGGRVVFALSDGMGHGCDAKNESRRTLEMLAVCLEAGYSREQTMQVVNGAMLNATGGELFATVDMGVIDLWTGETEMNKLGACSSYLVQGQKIVKLTGEALPLGILEYVTPSEKNVFLAEGDRVILLSDGIADAYDAEEDVMRMLHRRLSDNVQEMADAVLMDALERQNGLPPDDMTVLCIQLVPRYVRKKRSIPA